ncbi:hypothetical protein HAX54_041645, partial [Datura stramonium]|nr:hypothetical protein [Datura stramonium]
GIMVSCRNVNCAYRAICRLPEVLLEYVQGLQRLTEESKARQPSDGRRNGIVD